MKISFNDQYFLSQSNNQPKDSIGNNGLSLSFVDIFNIAKQPPPPPPPLFDEEDEDDDEKLLELAEEERKTKLLHIFMGEGNAEQVDISQKVQAETIKDTLDTYKEISDVVAEEIENEKKRRDPDYVPKT
jgi:hypothetical protein